MHNYLFIAHYEQSKRLAWLWAEINGPFIDSINLLQMKYNDSKTVEDVHIRKRTRIVLVGTVWKLYLHCGESGGKSLENISRFIECPITDGYNTVENKKQL